MQLSILVRPRHRSRKPSHQRCFWPVYVINDPTALPSGWHIEQSQAAPWFHQPGGGTQYRIIAPPGEKASVDRLVEFGYLKVVGK